LPRGTGKGNEEGVFIRYSPEIGKIAGMKDGFPALCQLCHSPGHYVVIFCTHMYRISQLIHHCKGGVFRGQGQRITNFLTKTFQKD